MHQNERLIKKNIENFKLNGTNEENIMNDNNTSTFGKINKPHSSQIGQELRNEETLGISHQV